MKKQFEIGQTVYWVSEGLHGVNLVEFPIVSTRITKTGDSSSIEYSENGIDFTSSEELYENREEAVKAYIRDINQTGQSNT